MNSTPPIAFFSTSLVFGAVWPIYWPTRSSRVTDDQVAVADVAELVQDRGHPQRHRGLAGAGIAGEGHVQRRRLPAASPIRLRSRSTSSSAAISRMRGLHRLQPDQLAVELVEHLADADAR